MNTKKQRRQIRTRSKVKGVTSKPRLSVYRSNKYMSVQLIDDSTGVTIAGFSEKNIKATGTKSEKAKQLGLKVAEAAKKKNLTKIVFDRGSYSYHGRVKQVAEGLREGGLEF